LSGKRECRRVQVTTVAIPTKTGHEILLIMTWHIPKLLMKKKITFRYGE
jgi:hypothetical protein